MNRMFWFAALCAMAMLVPGCATNGDVPLIFVQSNTAGIDIGTSASSQGADFVLGYKGSDFAIVPVTVVQGDGSTEKIEASMEKNGEKHSDALSVFGQFSINSNNNAKSPKSGLGRFFATGQAAKKLSDGYAYKLGKGMAMPETPSLDCFGAKAKRPAPGATAAAGGAGASPTPTPPPTPAAAPTTASATSGVGQNKTKTVKARSLVFAEHVNFGLVLTGSATEGAGGFSLGYKDQDVAVVPAISRQQDGNAIRLLGETPGEFDAFDALSVLGQFGSDVKSKSGEVDVDMGKFFVTGLAAKSLADGFAAKLCREYTAPAQ
ncbi:MAG: hypothetical protein HY067_10460 [Betaproteobacteria bacterium]|nr:hypothetical protein [Betaproteobacteria bacterium]